MTCCHYVNVQSKLPQKMCAFYYALHFLSVLLPSTSVRLKMETTTDFRHSFPHASAIY